MSRKSIFGLGKSSRALGDGRATALGPPPMPCASSRGTTAASAHARIVAAFDIGSRIIPCSRVSHGYLRLGAWGQPSRNTLAKLGRLSQILAGLTAMA